MTKTKPRGGAAVMADTMTAKQIDAEENPVRHLHLKLSYFPTPPWATRALLQHVIPDASGAAWEPACGGGHMAKVLSERFAIVLQSDVHDYGVNQVTGSFVGSGPDVIGRSQDIDWIITNPPFPLALEFVERALGEAREGVAVLVRTAWLEGGDRYDRLFRDRSPTIVAPFVERVPMQVGSWDPNGTTMTAYAWFVWRRRSIVDARWDHDTRLRWIPPGCRDRLTKPTDAARFAGGADGGAKMMFGEGV